MGQPNVWNADYRPLGLENSFVNGPKHALCDGPELEFGDDSIPIRGLSRPAPLERLSTEFCQSLSPLDLSIGVKNPSGAQAADAEPMRADTVADPRKVGRVAPFSSRMEQSARTAKIQELLNPG